jgi:hypothetical protein
MKDRKDLILQKCYSVTQWNHVAITKMLAGFKDESIRADTIVNREIRALADIFKEGVVWPK